jgi:MYXO-CTERM domain-containing protein
VIAEPSPADPATEPRKRVQSLPPEPDGHGPGPVVPMTVAAVLGFLMLLYVLRRRRRRHG